MGFWGWQWHQLDHMQTICSSCSIQMKTTSTPHHSIFTSRMLFLTPSQQRQSNEGIFICLTAPFVYGRRSHVRERQQWWRVVKSGRRDEWNYYYYYYFFIYLGRSSRGGRQKLILEIIALMVNHPSGSHQQSSRAAG